MQKPQQRNPNDLSRSLTALDMDTTLIAVVEMSQSSWLVAGIVPNVERQPLKSSRPTSERCSGCCSAGGTRQRPGTPG